MSYLRALDGLTAAVLDRLGGETVLVNAGPTSTALRAVFDAPVVDNSVGGSDTLSHDPWFVFRSADFVPLNASEGDTITRHGVDYAIVTIDPDVGGMTRCVVREYG